MYAIRGQALVHRLEYCPVCYNLFITALIADPRKLEATTNWVTATNCNARLQH